LPNVYNFNQFKQAVLVLKEHKNICILDQNTLFLTATEIAISHLIKSNQSILQASYQLLLFITI